MVLRNPLLAVATTAILLAAGRVNAADPNLFVSLNPQSSAAPDQITLEAADVDGETLAPDGTRHYAGTIALPSNDKWERHYVLTGSWGDISRQIYLRITSTTKCPLRLTMFNIDAAPDDDTLSKLNALGGDMNSLLKKYFVARDVYRSLVDVQTNVKYRALHMWFDAAYNLSKTYPYIEFDPDVKKSVAESGSDYYKPYLAQAAAFEWRDVGTVQPLLRDGKIAEAQGLTTFYLAKFNNLTPDQKKAVTAVTGVDGGVLEGNHTFVSNLSQ